MHSLLLHPTSTSQWQALIYEAQKSLSIRLNEDLESYLVFLLMRFTGQPAIAHSVLGLEFLDTHHQLQYRQGHPHLLKDVGDKCLLFAGLFPEHALRRRVDHTYYIKLGKSAYSTLSESLFSQNALLFSTLCTQFIRLTDILQATRDLNKPESDLIRQIELWQATQSKAAWKRLQNTTQSLPLVENPKNPKKSVH